MQKKKKQEQDSNTHRFKDIAPLQRGLSAMVAMVAQFPDRLSLGMRLINQKDVKPPATKGRRTYDIQIARTENPSFRPFSL